jgi:terminase large subunit-like protein
MRMHACSSTIENGFVYLPSEAEWLGTFIHEIKTFPNGKHDDQVDSVSQALSWVRARYMGPHMGLFWYYKERYDEAVARGEVEPDPELQDMTF